MRWLRWFSPKKARVPATVQRIRLQPGDIIVLEYDGRIRPEEKMQMRYDWKNLVPGGSRCLVLDGGLKVAAVLSPGPEADKVIAAAEER